MADVGLIFDFRPYRVSWLSHTNLDAEQFIYFDAPGDGNHLTYVGEATGTVGTPRVQWFEGSTTGDNKIGTGSATAISYLYQTGICPLDPTGEVGKLEFITLEYYLGTGTDESVTMIVEPYLADVAGTAVTYTLHASGTTGAGGTRRVRCATGQAADSFEITISGTTKIKNNIEIRKLLVEWVPLRALKGS
jgi:hypothetical protein